MSMYSTPPPKVKSAVIRMTRNDTRELGCDEALFKQIVKTTFNQRRKTLRNSIKPILGKDCPLTGDALFDRRPRTAVRTGIHRPHQPGGRSLIV